MILEDALRLMWELVLPSGSFPGFEILPCHPLPALPCLPSPALAENFHAPCPEAEHPPLLNA